jgi:hypothetical protein
MNRWTMGMTAALAAMLVAQPLGAQSTDLGAHCDNAIPEDQREAREACYVVAQAVTSAQPQLGVLMAAGNPTIGAASAGGIRLGVLPRFSISPKLNLVFVRVPDILTEQAGGAVQQLNEAVGIPVPALAGEVSMGIFPGFDVAPTLGSLFGVDLLANATWLPFNAFDVEGLGQEGNPSFAWGLGGRLGILRESFTTPGVSVSLMYRRLDRTAFGDVCPGGTSSVQGHQTCPGDGDPGEFAFDLGNWSTRAVIGKRLLGLGLVAGVGHDRYASTIDFGVRGDPGFIPVLDDAPVYRVQDVDLSASRWSAFVNASYTLLIGTIGLEVGWQEGMDPLPSFEQVQSDFDPRRSTVFGSLGLRVAL